MTVSQNIHHVTKVRVDRVIESVGTITLQFVTKDYKGNVNEVETTLFDLPHPQLMALWHNLSDKGSVWIGDDGEDQDNEFAERGRRIAEGKTVAFEPSNPIAVAAAKELSKDFDHIGG